MLLLAGIWDRKKLPSTHDQDESDEAPSWVCDFRLDKLEMGTTCPWDHSLDQDMDIESMESPRIRFETNPFSRRIHIGLILLNKIEDINVFPIEVGSDHFTLYRTLYSPLEMFKRARKLPLLELPSHDEMVRFAQVLGIKTRECPGAVTELAQLTIWG